jgi:hypothetical protein
MIAYAFPMAFFLQAVLGRCLLFSFPSVFYHERRLFSILARLLPPVFAQLPELLPNPVGPMLPLAEKSTQSSE